MTDDSLKLYVWEDVLRDHTTGMVCILAHDFEEARKVAEEKFEPYEIEEFFGRPYKVITKPDGFLVWGGG